MYSPVSPCPCSFLHGHLLPAPSMGYDVCRNALGTLDTRGGHCSATCFAVRPSLHPRRPLSIDARWLIPKIRRSQLLLQPNDPLCAFFWALKATRGMQALCGPIPSDALPNSSQGPSSTLSSHNHFRAACALTFSSLTLNLGRSLLQAATSFDAALGGERICMCLVGLRKSPYLCSLLGDADDFCLSMGSLVYCSCIMLNPW
jgi:hypothetical protein